MLCVIKRRGVGAMPLQNCAKVPRKGMACVVGGCVNQTVALQRF